jgi:hypothetical protein
MAGEICRIVAVANLTNIKGRNGSSDYRLKAMLALKIAPSVLMAVKKIIGNAVSSAFGVDGADFRRSRARRDRCLSGHSI